MSGGSRCLAVWKKDAGSEEMVARPLSSTSAPAPPAAPLPLPVADHLFFLLRLLRLLPLLLLPLRTHGDTARLRPCDSSARSLSASHPQEGNVNEEADGDGKSRAAVTRVHFTHSHAHGPTHALERVSASSHLLRPFTTFESLHDCVV